MRPTAVIGVRACDIAGLHIHDQHFAYREYQGHYYNRRRRALFLVAVDCARPADTCFCHSEGDTTELEGTRSAHHRQWDSCFSEGHSYMHSFVVRDTTVRRYRQWLTHKLGSWHDQYGRSGCVGCGRCITWCPVGIDIVETANAICGDPSGAQP